MSAMSDILENRLLDHVFRGITYTPPAAMFVALMTAAANDTGGGTEVTGGNYSRLSVTCNSTNWTNSQASGTGASTGTDGTIENGVTFTFPTPSAGWGTVVSCAVYDASSGGNLLWYGTLNTSKVINSGDVVDFPAGTLSFQIDN
jgi:hypothetical protein